MADRPFETLEQRLTRISEALARASAGPSALVPRAEISPAASRPERKAPAPGALAAGVLGIALLLAGGFTGGIALGVLGALLVAAFVLATVWMGIGGGPLSQLERTLAHDAGGAQIGLGATVSEDAVIEPGATIGMGATVRAGAIVRAGAVVSWGATVGKGAIVERNAVVSWGATVRTGAVVGEGSVVSWGATVGKNARMPAGTSLRAGASWSGRGQLPSAASVAPPPAAANAQLPAAPRAQLSAATPAQLPAAIPAQLDPRQQRLDAVCARLEAELRDAPEQQRQLFGARAETVAALRRTCEGLLRREAELRREADGGALVRLTDERTALAARAVAETDEATRRSLEGAVAALDQQLRQRELLKVAANRLEAEHTRLLYTLEGLAAQFVRLRTAGAEASLAPRAEVEAGVQQLGAEIDAIADALDEVSRDAPAQPQRVR